MPQPTVALRRAPHRPGSSHLAPTTASLALTRQQPGTCQHLQSTCDSMKIRKNILKCSSHPPILACNGCCLQLCPKGEEPQQEDALCHADEVYAQGCANQQFKVPRRQPGSRNGRRQLTGDFRNLPHLVLILFTEEPFQLHPQPRQEQDPELAALQGDSTRTAGGKGKPGLHRGRFFTAALNRNPYNDLYQ